MNDELFTQKNDEKNIDKSELNNGFKRKSSEVIIPKEVDCEDHASNLPNMVDL